MVDPHAESRVRLKNAVRRHRALSREGLLERLFERLFDGLVYTQIWEDPEIDLEALALAPDSRVVAIASGGCNILSYLTADPARITALDLSLAHVALNLFTNYVNVAFAVPVDFPGVKLRSAA